jgi:hypothetical protein
VSKPRPLPYRQLINRLQMMECCIPALPTVANAAFLVYRWGAASYNSKPGGPRCTLIHRENDYLVPVREIEYVLNFLDIPHDLFWQIQDHTTIPAAAALEATSGPVSTAGNPMSVAAVEVETIQRSEPRKPK